NAAGANIVTFGVSLATNITLIDDTTLTCDAPAGPLRANGDVTVRNLNGADTLAGGIQWFPQIPADINYDGYADLIIGAPGHTVTSLDDGAVYVFLGGPGGIADADAGTADLILLPTLSGSEFGARLASMDVSGDDIPDLLVSAYRDDTVGPDAGAVYVFLGPLSASPTPILSTDADIVLLAKTPGDFFGTSLDSGDMTGDGIADILVGAKLNDGFGTDAGEVYAFFGGPTLASSNALSASATFTPMNVRSEFGTQVRAVDFDLDGTCDVLIGAPKDSVAGGNSGSVYIFKGDALMGTEAAANAEWRFDGEASGDFFGTAIATGDVNVDGIPDLVVGAPLSDRTARVAGAAYVFFGGPAQTGASASTADVLFGAERLGDRMGNDIDVTDVNGDGIDDILIGSPFSSVTVNQAGRAYVVFGGVDLASIELSSAPVIFTAEPNVGDHFGTVVTAQDVDGDGINDIIVSANMNDTNGSASGRTYVFMGGPGLTDTLAAIGDATLSGEATADSFGSSIVGTR
ncbi:MAG: hypothetical protein CMJ89_09115, partial [Planctomycetes bacterium]|nr:hypothetical protein [Planctomycetota bacterium]